MRWGERDLPAFSSVKPPTSTELHCLDMWTITCKDPPNILFCVTHRVSKAFVLSGVFLVNLPRFVGRVQSSLVRISRRPLTIGTVFSTLFTSLAFLAIAITPELRRGSITWNDPSTIAAAGKGALVPILAALYLKLSERYRQLARADHSTKRNRIARKLTAGNAINNLHRYIRTGTSDASQLQSIREAILECVVHSVREVLQVADHEKVVASLVSLDSDPEKMLVEARSTRERPVAVSYPKDQLVAWEAIRNGHIVTVDDVSQDSRWDPMGTRRYRAVVAVPVTRGGKAFGAVSIDSELTYAFFGRSAELSIHLEPYVALMSQTFKDSDRSIDCKYAATHVH